VRYEQVEMFDETIKVTKKKEESMEENIKKLTLTWSQPWSK
jgi:hypothetical protein